MTHQAARSALLCCSTRGWPRFRFPAWAAEDVAEGFAPVLRTAYVAHYVAPLMQGDAHGIIGVDVLGQTINRGLLDVLMREGAEESVPDDEGGAVVAVEIAAVGSVVHTVMARRVEDVLKRAHRSNDLGVDPELVYKADGLHG